MGGKFVSYYRLSQDSRGIDGLQIDAQRFAVGTFMDRADRTLIGEFVEVERGARRDRPELSKAIELARVAGAKLIIAKLDRLSRDLHFLTGLESAGVDFVACDLPDASRLTVHIMAAMAQAEREMISQRTRDGLASIKAKLARGEVHVSKRGRFVERLGNPNGISQPRRELGVQAVKRMADEFAGKVAPTILSLRAAGHSLAAIAAKLNEMGVPTARGLRWTPTAVRRVLQRIAGRGAAA